MSPHRIPRWIALLALPLLVGAFLLMHGLDARAGTIGATEVAAAAPAHVEQDGHASDHDDEHCGTCAVGHVMAACVAIVATVTGVRLTRRLVGVRVPTLLDAATSWTRDVREVLRDPEPAWVRLAVMRC